MTHDSWQTETEKKRRIDVSHTNQDKLISLHEKLSEKSERKLLFVLPAFLYC